MNTIGKYKIIKELGSGGFGAVYLCEDQLGQQVAIKIYQPKDDAVAGAATSATADAGEVLKQRFKEEAKILHQLSDNTYIVNFMHYDETEDGTPYYVMPFLDRSLVEEIGKDAFSVGAREDLDPELFPRKLPLTRALEVLEQTTKALRAVHRAGLVHRDIKPANILLDKTGQVQLCDFGIAKLPDVEHSQSGVGMGSRNYMSPEQRESAKHVNAASDIYSLGVIAYRIITGTLPVGHFDEPMVLSPAIGNPLNKLILKSLSFDVDKRPQDAQTFLTALKEASKQSNTNEIENDEGTGTWIDEGTSSLKDELWPLYEKIKEAWLNNGMIDVEEHEMFTAMAAVVDLSDDDLNALIKQVEQDHSKVIKPVQNFIKLIDKRIAEQLSPSQRALNQSTLSTLALASQSLNWDDAKLKTILKERSAHIIGLFGTESEDQTNEAEPEASLIPDKKVEPASPPIQESKQSNSKPLIVLMVLLLLGSLGYGGWWYNNDQVEQVRLAKQSAEEEQQIEQIKQAQSKLMQLGYRLTETGKLDARTQQVILAFENKEKLLETGEVDTTLISALNTALERQQARLAKQAAQEKAAAKKVRDKAEAKRIAKKKAKAKADRLAKKKLAEAEELAEEKQAYIILVKATQFQLNRLGYKVGTPDGQLGNKTNKAIVHYQKGYKLNQSGSVSESLLAHLERATKKPAPPIGSTFKDCTNCPEMVVIPAGSFQMGSNESDDEKPIHTVNIRQPFSMGKYEVTKGQFALFISASGYQTDADKGEAKDCSTNEDGEWKYRSNRNWRKVGYKQGNTMPVVCVSWNDAKAYAEWLSKKTGKQYRLPSESEWEYAARADSRKKFHFGNDQDKMCQYGNGLDQTKSPTGDLYKNRAMCHDGYYFTAPVGNYKANGFGLYDMHGNVWEWTQDCWNASYGGAPSSGDAWGSGDCSRRVVRGGSWDITPAGLRSANRYYSSRANRVSINGFRLAQDL